MIAADCVRGIHVLLIVYMVTMPFFGNLDHLILAASGYILLFFHWFLNNDMCTLTVLEQKLRGVSKGETFMQSVVGPVYGLGTSQVTWALSAALFFVALVRLRAAILSGQPSKLKDIIRLTLARISHNRNPVKFTAV